MDLLPTTLGTRPRLAVELRAEGAVAAQAQDATAILSAVSRAEFAGALVPGLRPGNVVDRSRVVAAVKAILDEVSGREANRDGGRGRDVTLIVPDAAVRVLLLDFDELPARETEALPIVRFRLKKLLPFDVEESIISYQVMASAKGSVQVMAVAIPAAVLKEYESVVTAAGYLPGAVLPSTLAALAGLESVEAPSLVVNICSTGLTTAIVRGGILLLHRSVDMSAAADGTSVVEAVLPAGGREDLVAEWAQRNAAFYEDQKDQNRGPQRPEGEDRIEAMSLMQSAVVHQAEMRESAGLQDGGNAVSYQAAAEVAQAVSVAAAYFEDTLQVPPGVLLYTGTCPVEAMKRILAGNEMEGLKVRDMVDPAMLLAGAATASVPRGWLAGVRGALKD